MTLVQWATLLSSAAAVLTALGVLVKQLQTAKTVGQHSTAIAAIRKLLPHRAPPPPQ